MKKLEKINEEIIKKFEITFTNTRKFYISAQTITSFINKLRKLDPLIEYNPKEDGTLENSKIIHIKSSLLSVKQINELIKEFTVKYDWLVIAVVVKG